MILTFAGDPFLANRAAKRALKARGFRPEEITELGEGMTPAEVSQVAAQGGLFGQVALLLDFDSAFSGQGGVKPRNDTMKALETVPPDGFIVVLDLEATAARQKIYEKLGLFESHPTPRFNALTNWVRQELTAEKVRFESEVPQLLADLFGEDLPSIAAEIQKLTVLDEELSAERVRTIVNRPAARDAFDLIETVAQRDVKGAITVCRSLIAQGEAPPRVMGALSWQYNLIARCVGLRESRGRIDGAGVAQALKVKPFVANKALNLAKNMGEDDLLRVLTALLKADVAMKTGKDEVLALESLAIELCGLH